MRPSARAKSSERNWRRFITKTAGIKSVILVIPLFNCIIVRSDSRPFVAEKGSQQIALCLDDGTGDGGDDGPVVKESASERNEQDDTKGGCVVKRVGVDVKGGTRPHDHNQKKTKTKSNSKFVPINVFEEGSCPVVVNATTVSTPIVGCSHSTLVSGAKPATSPWKVPVRDAAPPTMAEFMEMTGSSERRQPLHRSGPSLHPKNIPGVASAPSASLLASAGSDLSGGGLTLDAFICTSQKQQKRRGNKHGEPTGELDTPVKERAASCPWITIIPPAHSPTSTSNGTPPMPHSSAQTGGKARRLSDIQREEELERVQSNLKQLQGHSSPWLIDRRNARAHSLETVMSTQQDERERARLQAEEEREVAEAIAAVERMTRMEAERMKSSGNRKEKKSRVHSGSSGNSNTSSKNKKNAYNVSSNKRGGGRG
jgi:hypothetical protein